MPKQIKSLTTIRSKTIELQDLVNLNKRELKVFSNGYKGDSKLITSMFAEELKYNEKLSNMIINIKEATEATMWKYQNRLITNNQLLEKKPTDLSRSERNSFEQENELLKEIIKDLSL